MVGTGDIDVVVPFKSIFTPGFQAQLNTKDRVMNETQLYVCIFREVQLVTDHDGQGTHTIYSQSSMIHCVEYQSCSSRPSSASVGRMAIEAKSTLQQSPQTIKYQINQSINQLINQSIVCACEVDVVVPAETIKHQPTNLSINL